MFTKKCIHKVEFLMVQILLQIRGNLNSIWFEIERYEMQSDKWTAKFHIFFQRMRKKVSNVQGGP